ncbi:PREDICTED: AT-hook motif nuclear-localized protein 3-like [Camelina sativa]|uniref:AT-hook motif nuclear-localized protein n=1 Tax=Camelina sativa TaxID=90675 RepID=A0ABM0TZH5_CAMSA|nr:PREDICTED: AT-hook motif nuclear-localized protein 3-like [Camelina sativa]
MEEREGTNIVKNHNITSSSFGLKQQHEAAASSDGGGSGYSMDPPPRPDNPNPFLGQPITVSSAATSSVAGTVADNAAPQFSLTMPAENASSEQMKKRRGRPRKYNPDGTLAVTLSPMPISSSVPLTSEFPPRKRGRGRGRGKSSRWLKKSQMFQFDRSPVDTNIAGAGTADFVGANFTPHVLTVNAGEDVTMKIMTFSQQGSRAICILSANGPISNVTLRQSMTSGGTLTYEGRFEILSLTGSFMQNDSGGTRSRAGGMSVCLAGPDGRVFGGGLAGLFLAAGPVQVMVGTFVAGQEQSQLELAKERRQRFGAQPSSISFNITAEERKARFERLNNSVAIPAQTTSYTHANTTNAVHSYYTNSVNHVKDPFTSIPVGARGDGGEEEGEEDEEDDDELEGDEEEFGGDSQSDNEIPS